MCVCFFFFLFFFLKRDCIMGAGLNIESLLWVEESEKTFFLPESVLLQPKKLLYINQMTDCSLPRHETISLHFMRL